jgi:hypothetical protein
MTNLQAFNTQLENFINYLEQTFPNEMSIKTYHTSILLLKKVNPRKILDFFATYIYIYKDQIMNNNSDFFMKKDYSTELQNNNDSMLQAIKFKELWTDVNEDQHAQIFRYFQLLCMLAEKC